MEDLWRAFLSEDLGLPMVSSLVTGIFIGYEREFRGKAAGLRTHALVCLASTLVMLAAARQAEWFVSITAATDLVTDPTRMAHGVLTGIGFLCAGVIFRQGPSVHGLTTAASLWATASIGLLYGVGMYWLAVSGTLLTLTVLSVLRLLEYLMPKRLEARLLVVVDARSSFTAATLRELLGTLVLPIGPVAQSLNRANHQREFLVQTRFQHAEQADRVVRALGDRPEVVGLAVLPQEDDAAAELSQELHSIGVSASRPS